MRSVKAIEKKPRLVLTLDGRQCGPALLLTDYHLITARRRRRHTHLADRHPPYKLAATKPASGNFEKNTADWRSDRGYVDSVEIIVMNDNTARIAALSSGQVHFINGVDPKTWPLLSVRPASRSCRPRARVLQLPHALDTAPFDNNDLRLALKYAIDRRLFSIACSAGYGTLGNVIRSTKTTRWHLKASSARL